MAAKPTTGNTGTIVLGTSGVSFPFTKIGEWQATRDKLDASSLATTAFKEYIPGDLAEPGEVEVEGWFEGKDDLGSINAVAETITITYPKTDSSSAAGGNLAGTGFVTMVNLPELVNGSLMVAKFKVAFDGDTGPAYTKES